ncbi:sugar phosphate isomerase/epimerase [Amycolatopsis bartoniae]|uniref:Xylose isomerase-like TIM barrel domain-containing protein n=1 Tax=Amycolatopsis bartoniae TaxID=941986 RepID=A0A8H9IT53_9PSEU|nr:sugar phosphate isomerase/epimerase [Amycolatopsis bartoniae]MBB2940233.1 sugar phosphate isomerase/epimerase [Amycolatopsis bartoniae]TVT10190.1 sugar phosphate isomerase/epimerase [Amycolatopsis bartoniae]GHF35007.1 hypothetical protein GCM10017566_04650 [Amycolatopsis bartoniae]
MGLPKLGVTLYSFNADYYTYRYSFDDCMAAVGSLGPGQGVEVVGPQMIRGFPDLSPEFEARFNRLVERHDLRPSAYGAYVDGSRLKGQYAPRDEQIDYLARQIRAAARLGFKVIRMPLSNVVLEDMLPYAERYDVKMGMEIHAPMTVETLEPVIEQVKRADSPYLGFTPDCGTMCHSPATVYARRFREQGVPDKIVDHVLARWQDRVSSRVIAEEVAELGGGKLGEVMAIESGIYFGHGEPEALKEILPHIVHVHGKFFGIDDSGTDSAVRFPEIISILVAGGYDGFISCEYEGHHWDRDLDALEQIRTVQRFISGRVEAAGKQA